MLRIVHSFLLGALPLLAIACAPPEASAPDAHDSATGRTRAGQPSDRGTSSALPRIVLLGDSLTAGYGLARDQSVPALIQARVDSEGYRYEVVNAGVSGDTSAGGLSRLEWSLAGDVAVLVIELGANDGLRGLPVSQLKRNLSEIITRAGQRDITVILTGMEAPPNYGPAYTSEFRQAFRDLAREHRIGFIPFYLDGVAGIAGLNLSDGLHPNAAGARIIEQTVWRALEPVLEKQRSLVGRPD